MDTVGGSFDDFDADVGRICVLILNFKAATG